MTAQILFRQEPDFSADLRSRKKERIRLAIRDAALALFAEQGYEATSIEQIASRAETSVTTFFRYFRGKADLLVSDDGTQLQALQRAIVGRPAAESDLAALCGALLDTWAHAVADPDRVLRMAAAVESSALLRGLRYDVIRGWLAAVADALAQRHRRKTASRWDKMIARIVVGVFSDSVEDWIANGCRGDLGRMVKRDFKAMMALREEMALPVSEEE
jgi:AcrR family transcriptional regulator